MTRTAIITASAAPVDPSYIEAFAISMPVSSQIIVWNSKIACSVPCVISGLVRRVRGQKLAALHQRIDHHRPIVPVRAGAQKARVAVGILRRGML